MIKVQFDHQIFSMQNYGGISRYFSSLSNFIGNSAEFEHRLRVLFSRNAYLSDQHSILPKVLGDFLLKDYSSYNKYNRRYFKAIAALNRFDVFHPTYYHPYFLKLVKKPVVITVHDMIHELYPSFFPNDPTTQNKREVLARADHVIAISQTTKDDLKSIMNMPEENISVIHHGYFEPVVYGEPRKVSLRLPARYLLFVGSRAAYKNFSRMVEAIAPILNSDPDLSVVCAGGGPFSMDEEVQLRKLGLSKKVLQMNVAEQDMPALYKSALLFIFPSLYEGFGLPILEAFHNLCPIAISRTPSFNEVAGGAASYFDPLDLHSINRTVSELIDSKTLRNQLTAMGRLRLHDFGSAKCLQKTAEIYKRIVQG